MSKSIKEAVSELSQDMSYLELHSKLREANAEIERQKGLVRNYLETIEGNEIDIAGLLEKLRAVGELTEKWRDADLNRRYPTDAPSVEDCADELEALLKEERK